jgi:hypothetical protein
MKNIPAASVEAGFFGATGLMGLCGIEDGIEHEGISFFIHEGREGARREQKQHQTAFLTLRKRKSIVFRAFPPRI